MAGTFHLLIAKDEQFYFHLKASNGEIILASERYVAKAGALNGIESVKKNSSLDQRYDKRTSTNGKPYFVLKAGNGEVIGNSEMYETEESRDNGIESVKRHAPEASVVDGAGA